MPYNFPRPASATTAFFDDKMVIDRKNISMNSQTLGLRLAGIIFGLVCLGHLWRLIRHTDVMIGSHLVPMWASVMGLIIAGVMSIWMWQLSSRRGG
jgi:tetrahydromethanopterin S-methyltransferase subunit E